MSPAGWHPVFLCCARDPPPCRSCDMTDAVRRYTGIVHRKLRAVTSFSYTCLLFRRSMMCSARVGTAPEVVGEHRS